MVQIIEQMDLGEEIGRGLGSGGVSALQMLIQAKLKGMQQREKMAQLQSILGGADTAGTDLSVDLIEDKKEPARGEITDSQILAVSQLDPNLAKIMQSQKDSSSKEKASRFKETKEARKDIVKQAQAARENDMRLGRMQELNRSGKLISGLYNDALKKFGIDFDVLKNPESIEFQKLSTDFLRNAKEIFGARVTNFEVNTFLKAIPSLSQSPEGRERIIRNLQLFNKGAQLRLNAMKDVMKENKGVPPYDLSEQIEEKIGPQLGEISEEFIKGSSLTSESSQVFEKLPSPKDHTGKVIRDTETGKRYKSNGKTWKALK